MSTSTPFPACARYRMAGRLILFACACLVVNSFGGLCCRSPLDDATFSGATLFFTSPVKGTVWKQGERRIVAWEGSGLGETVQIDYEVDNGGSWHLVVYATSTEPTGGSYEWRIAAPPPEPVGLLRLRIADVASGTIAFSEHFTVEPHGVKLAFTSPKAGDVWAHGEDRVIAWEGENIGSAVTIHYETPYERFLIPVVQGAASGPNGGTFKWTLPLDLLTAPNDKGRLYISENGPAMEGTISPYFSVLGQNGEVCRADEDGVTCAFDLSKYGRGATAYTASLRVDACRNASFPSLLFTFNGTTETRQFQPDKDAVVVSPSLWAGNISLQAFLYSPKRKDGDTFSFDMLLSWKFLAAPKSFDLTALKDVRIRGAACPSNDDSPTSSSKGAVVAVVTTLVLLSAAGVGVYCYRKRRGGAHATTTEGRNYVQLSHELDDPPL